MRMATNFVLGLAAATVMGCGSSSARAPIEAPPSAAATTTQPAAQAPAPVVVAQPEHPAEPVVAAPIPSEAAQPAAPVTPPAANAAPNAAPGTPVKTAAVLGVLSGQSGGAIADIFGMEGNATTVKVSSAKGGLDAQATQRVMAMAQANFEMCANKVAAKAPNRQNVALKLTFRIGPKGNTSAVSAKGPGKLQAKCMADLVRKLQFEQSKKATKVSATISIRRPGELFGAGGLGLRGIGKGGGGTGHGTIGLGSIGTIGHGSGSGSGYGRGSGTSVNSARPPSPQVRVGNAVATGDLDKNIIRRYIRRKLPRIRFCYEKVLIKKPSLSGTVVVNFEISPEGTVTKAEAKGVDTAVSDCVAKTLRTTQFPKPRNGGKVTVRYPFTFMPAK